MSTALARVAPRAELSRRIFAAKVRAARSLLGWSQTQFATRLGMTQRAVCKIEQADVTVRKSTEDAISSLFYSLGLQFETLPDGGFVIRVGGRILRGGDDRTSRRGR